MNKRQKTALDRIAKRQQAGDESHIADSEIPPLTERQVAEFRRPVKTLVAVRLDQDVLDWLKQFGAGYSTRINSILRAVKSQNR